MPVLRNNRQILKEGETITTGNLQAGGILAPEQASHLMLLHWETWFAMRLRSRRQGKLIRLG